jgi:hypothetical protein
LKKNNTNMLFIQLVVIKSRVVLITHSNQHLLRSNADENCCITNENDLIIATLRHLVAGGCTACHSWSQRRVRELLPDEKVPKHWAMVWLTGIENITQSGFLLEFVFIIGSHQEIDLAN